jgi:hypothetical protein
MRTGPNWRAIFWIGGLLLVAMIGLYLLAQPSGMTFGK